MPLADAAESWLAAHYDDVVAWRRHFHRNPELGFSEFATTQFVAQLLKPQRDIPFQLIVELQPNHQIQTR